MEASCWRSRPGGPSYPKTVTLEHLVLAAPAPASPWLQRWPRHRFDPCASWHSQNPGQAAVGKVQKKYFIFIEVQLKYSLTFISISPIRIFF